MIIPRLHLFSTFNEKTHAPVAYIIFCFIVRRIDLLYFVELHTHTYSDIFSRKCGTLMRVKYEREVKEVLGASSSHTTLTSRMVYFTPSLHTSREKSTTLHTAIDKGRPSSGILQTHKRNKIIYYNDFWTVILTIL